MKSITLILLVGFIVISCSTKSDRDIFDGATKLLEENKIPESISEFEKIVTDFPESELAAQALIQLAGIYHGKKLPTVSPRVSLEKADSLFYLVYQKYPNSNDAPLGLFMSGFIQANELEDYQKATATYNTFLNKYPDHEMAISAKQELENMGLTPEEILRKNLAKQE